MRSKNNNKQVLINNLFFWFKMKKQIQYKIEQGESQKIIEQKEKIFVFLVEDKAYF
ncbi:hypothetical protein TTHERM_00191980 (macronuclear) [Tetrahymena thermophila SB210]|uniref:Uncharacterized protein n=1 Tax=Tetrahymena thermophila (strain SB210) TaxID=312017 RepID=I7LV27_TETTS|nr:hypothetical protein TTHERM_00191980 [Tetrahymena thermophila SB210]EAR96529.1 hypothetical protein TTHERM_00191980 [Tetrahymena thermophila SB210]|eukprot:XP_001016774.1 hypothetical protein TTHERM_00191980 [Tetrahymena thermophila SB210]